MSIFTKLETTFLRNYKRNNNRMNRGEFWLTYLTVGLIYAFLVVPPFVFFTWLGGLPVSEVSPSLGLFVIWLAVITLGCVGVFSFLLVRTEYFRLQDLNCPGRIAYYLFSSMVLIAMAKICYPTIINPGYESKLYTYMSATVLVVYYIALAFWPGSKGKNQYGNP